MDWEDVGGDVSEMSVTCLLDCLCSGCEVTVLRKPRGLCCAGACLWECLWEFLRLLVSAGKSTVQCDSSPQMRNRQPTVTCVMPWDTLKATECLWTSHIVYP